MRRVSKARTSDVEQLAGRLAALSITIVLMAMVVLILGACGNTAQAGSGTSGSDAAAAAEAEAEPVEAAEPVQVDIEIADYGTVTLELDPSQAPITVDNFVKLAKSGFYDGLTFHRIMDGFMIQGGDPEGTGMGGPDYTIKGEFAANGFRNELKHDRGVLSMARAQHPDSAGSQFFIMHADGHFLDGQYAAFGKLTSGEDVLDRIASVRTNFSDRPRQEQKMVSVTVDTFGVDYPEPEKV